jgi:DNA repair protein RecO
MQRSQDQGIILHIKPYRETSAIISVLTQQHGLVRGVLRGYRRLSKNASSVRPLSLVDLSFSGAAELKTLFNVDLVRSFTRYPHALSYSMILTEVCHKLLPAEQEEEDLYLILLESLRLLDTRESPASVHVINFILAFLVSQGYELENVSSSLEHLMAKTQNESLSNDEQKALLEQGRKLLSAYYPNRVIKSFNLLLRNRNEVRS